MLAIGFFDQAIKLYPGNYEARFSKGVAELDNQELEAAIFVFRVIN